MIKSLSVDLLRLDGGTQMRDAAPSHVVDEYADTWRAAKKNEHPFPPLTAFFDGVDYWLGDGFLRLSGAKRAGRASIAVDVREGSQRDAILFACSANAEHGARRTNADKRKAVATLLSDEEWRKRSDRWIADSCRVSTDLVSEVRRELERAGEIAPQNERVGVDGKAYRRQSGVGIDTCDEETPTKTAKTSSDPRPEPSPSVAEECEPPPFVEAPAAADPDSLPAVQADLREYERRLRELARYGRQILGAEGNEITRPWCGCYSILTLINPLQHVARTVLNDLPVGGEPDNPKLYREQAAEEAG